MARVVLGKTNTTFKLRELCQLTFFNLPGGRRFQSKVGAITNKYEQLLPNQRSKYVTVESDTNGEEAECSCCWVPHPRSGIYSPKGHESVLDDVPENAASFNNTYWLRNVDETLDHKLPISD